MANTLRFLPSALYLSSLIPTYLCPVLRKSLPISLVARKRNVRSSSKTQKRRYQLGSANSPTLDPPVSPHLLALPRSCPGCGAFTQSVNPEGAGFYSSTRRSVKAFVTQHARGQLGEAETFKEVLGHANRDILQKLGLNEPLEVSGGELCESPLYIGFMTDIKKGSKTTEDVPTPVCNRCHDLLHHHAGVPIVHPTINSIQDMISESPYKYNHVYHVLDAADFPMSLVPQLQRHLELTPQRSQNRRAKTQKFYHGRMAEMSFIITRSDLLAPQKEQVDKLMPYLTEVLRDALGRSGADVRLGNVRCVSSMRGWWTKQIKDDIWNRGGGGWMVGKVNVGKSNLFECIFPKGRHEDVNFTSLRRNARKVVPSDPETGLTQELGATSASDPSATPSTITETCSDLHEEPLLEDSLLPPAPMETPYPVMPIVSSLPGTTVSPIRLLFGSGKGELIDLPGLSRGNIEDHVMDEHKLDLVMRSRIKPEQLVIKPKQSLLLGGGLVRITPTTPNATTLAYPFVPLKAHVTSTEKAVAIQNQEQPSGVSSILKPGVGALIASAGSLPLKWDVTKQRAGPLTATSAGGLHTKVLPFIVYSTDILIEGCGWVELVVQVRKKDIESHAAGAGEIVDGAIFPTVEVFTPNGKHVGTRRPMNGWLLGGPNTVPARKRGARPRRSMKGVKKAMKIAKRNAPEN